MKLVEKGHLIIVGILATLSASPAQEALAQSQCSFNVSVPDGAAPVAQLVSSSGTVWMSNVGSGPAAGTLFDLADARFALEPGASATIRVMEQDIVLQPESFVKLVQQGGSICVEINAYSGLPNMQPQVAATPIVPSITPIAIPIVIGAGAGAALLLGDDGDGSSSN